DGSGAPAVGSSRGRGGGSGSTRALEPGSAGHAGGAPGSGGGRYQRGDRGAGAGGGSPEARSGAEGEGRPAAGEVRGLWRGALRGREVLRPVRRAGLRADPMRAVRGVAG